MTGKINDDTGKINDDTGKINDDTGLIENSTGMLEENTGLINDDTGKIIDNDSTEDTVNGRRKRSKERGRDLKPRNFPLHTLKNLPQFRDKPHEEVRQYILETKGVDIGGNLNFGKMMLWVFVILAIVAGGIGIAKWLQQKQEKKNDEDMLGVSF